MDRQIEGLLGLYERGKMSRRGLVRALAAVALGAPLGGAARVPAHAREGADRDPPIRVRSLNHVTCFVSDMGRTVAFYQDLFGLPVQSDQGIGLNLTVGEGPEFVGIFELPSRPIGIGHFCLGVEDFDVDRIMRKLEERGVEARVRMRDGEVPEIYLRDPDGIEIQLQDPAYCGGSGRLGDECG